MLAVVYRRFGTAFLYHFQGSSSARRMLECLTPEIGLIGCHEALVSNYENTICNHSEWQKPVRHFTTPLSSLCLLPPTFQTKIIHVFFTSQLSAMCATCLILLHLIIPRMFCDLCKVQRSTQFSGAFFYFSYLDTDIHLVSTLNLETEFHTQTHTPFYVLNIVC